ncbi:DUF2156 domain-containing protein [Aminipila sp.]|jgi:hypothetical protein|uniref:DUF2156 domain-containing protein n=1 Tax=Aminipila sp. TaxID=2060095 RepID=UPI001D615C4D|nr:phosphatidylglycerol lysyltransferase domain-containing protein [Aminipila sp.]MBE6033546.1 DUF2156 domain-containing protein [Clostridiales bacterium]
MSIFKNEITIESREILNQYLSAYEYRTSGLSFSSLYMWREQNEFSWEIIGDYLLIAGLSHLEIDKHEYFLFPPLTKTGSYEPESLRKTLHEARRKFKEKESGFTIRLLPVHMQKIIEDACPGEVEFISDRPNYDYLYLKQDLIDLKGRSYHAKKNHLNYFLNNYEYQYVELTPNMLDTVMVFLKEFNARKVIAPHEMKWLLMETDAMRDVVLNLDKLNYIAGAIVIDGKVEAFSIGGRLGEKTVTVHVEKANSSIRGLYPAINNEFCKHLDDSILYVNREEDMGITNLRKAKLSYKPIELVEKYIVNFKKEN